ncbi:multiple epidermal growth factor-like domains protein 8 [Narcine bancroftii]|uniref:multiple epidermal growth factor-like domains protein 8 n=1 Tax=Narcine bancroftii TaxID=1343680 RepID=UPI00383205CE
MHPTAPDTRPCTHSPHDYQHQKALSLLAQEREHDGRCVCHSGFIGHSCHLSLNDNQSAGTWYNVSMSDPAFLGRTAAAGAFLNTTNCFYLFGGTDLNRVLGDLVQYNFTSNKWQRIDLVPSPVPRHAHCAVEWRGGMLVSGGELRDTSLARDVWLFLPLAKRWKLMEPRSLFRPPGLASHSVAVVDQHLYIFGGRTDTDRFSSAMFRFHLELWVWEEVVATGGRSPAVAGHSMIFHPASRMLLVHGGHQISPRFSYRTNTTSTFHVDYRYWGRLNSELSAHSPRERAFHTATLVGNYMVVYGGNVHIHYREEKCYDDGIFFYHLGCHQWVPGEKLGVLVSTGDGRERRPLRGRFGHMAALMNGNVLLVAGGFGGRPLGDLVAYKVPIYVSQVLVQNVHLDYCSLYGAESGCRKDPACVWCQGRCQTYQVHSTCPHLGCLGLARLLTDCQSCLVFGQSRQLPPQAPGSLGWCVQTVSCLPTTEQDRCRVETVSGTVGWWGAETTFISSLDQCERADLRPGLHLLTYLHPVNLSQPDQVEITAAPTLVRTPRSELIGVSILRGFVHPLFEEPVPSDTVTVAVKIQRLQLVAQIGRRANSLDMEEVGHWESGPERETRVLQRNSGGRLFPDLERGNKYAIRLEGMLNNSGHGQASEMTLTWERSKLLGMSEISYHFLEPFRSDDCDSLGSCQSCLTDQGCSWCPETRRCQVRAAGTDSQCGRDRLPVLTPTDCPLCDQHTECELCSGDPFCEWVVSRTGDIQCVRRGRWSHGVRDPSRCPPPCYRRTSCQECLGNSSQCAWCQSTQTCFFFASYLAKYPFGECRVWSDSIHSGSKCTECSRSLGCAACLQGFGCGWCGDTNNPTIGRCVPGDFGSLRGFADCSVAVVGLSNRSGSDPAAWSYAVCPDIDECRLQLDDCHPFARCRNTFQSFQCDCGRGYTGDGQAFCNRTCYNECRHGHCSGAPDFSCVCQLGWTSNTTSVNLTGTECNVDCGCNFHSTCSTGIGICDQCQDWTMGKHCELCRPGSYSNASSVEGCRPCDCNGHGVLALGECNRVTGVCHCTDHTEGDHCQACTAGFYGDPRDGGTCYHECAGRSLLLNVSSSALGSLRGSGLSANGLTYCLWVLSTSDSLEPCQVQDSCPVVSLTIHSDIQIQCGHDYVYVYDGLPAFLTGSQPESGIHFDPRLLGAFCGRGGVSPVTVWAVSGVLTVYFEANVTRSASARWESFNATFAVGDCQGPCHPLVPCDPTMGCHTEHCPGNCSWHLGAGVCNTDLGHCICVDGFTGADCSSQTSPGSLIWETLSDGGLPHPRFGHSMVEGPTSTFWVFGGLSLQEGILGSLYSYSVTQRRWSQELRGKTLGPTARYFHAAATDPSRLIMFVLGGLTLTGVTHDFWLLNMSTLEWRQQQADFVPRVVGHTLTLTRNTSLLLIGGYSPLNGFNDKLLEYSLASGTWRVAQTTGTAPTGLYGHTSVYHDYTDAIYVFGGYRFHLETVSASAELYGLYLPTLTWSLIAPARGPKPPSRFFHTAGLLHHTMVVVGGRSQHRDFTHNVLLYHIGTNTWVRPYPTGMSVLGEPLNGSIAQAAVTFGDKLYVSGGFSGVMLGSLVSVSVPLDPCRVFGSPENCSDSTGGCVWCRSVDNGSCLSTEEADRLSRDVDPSPCDPWPRLSEPCRHLKTCSECLALHPRIAGQTQRQRCKWCTNCPEGACISAKASCSKENDCRINQREIFLAGNCSEISCEASDCYKCTASSKCMWTRQFKRTGETRRILSVSPTYDWTCFSHSLRNVSPMPVESSPPATCPTPCHEFTACPDCLASTGADGGWQCCIWSLALRQCMSPSFLPLRCAGGMCGRTLRGRSASCGLGCAVHQQCSHCVRHSHCGWCSTPGLNGVGRCMEGGLSGPWHGGPWSCGQGEGDGNWSFMSCPSENECLNGHHDCDSTQNCTDRRHGYLCICRPGYMQDSVLGLCRPVCEQGCVNGTCVEPNHCRCHFGYVGPQCSVTCRCNQHSECESVSTRDHCLQCVNNTKGDHCEKCQPLYVGSAVDGGRCESCSTFCNNNTHVCVTKEEYEKWRQDPERFPLTTDQIPSWVLEGPTQDNALCVECQNNSSGERCQTCLEGYFLLDGRCTKCQCNGHWDKCRTSDGTECQCQNNTETSCPTAQTAQKECYRYQCARCKENFLGNPTEGRQCYRQITVELEYCFDPTSQSNCYHEPQRRNLGPGRTVFFAVQPKFTNVDIRVTVDVTFGAVDVHLSNSHSALSVEVDPATGMHTVRLGGEEEAAAPGANGSAVWEVRAGGLTTYATVCSQRAVLVVRGLSQRLVVTFPYQLHSLKTQRFFLALLGLGPGDSQGLLFFRQDQAHIDLFVFFSVFFSCFFLFLSVCVLLWKAKQWLDARQERLRHLQEMDKMASRPFARLAVYLPPPRRRGPRTGEPPGFPLPLFRVGPLTLEPTEDGGAAVATLLLQLPGGSLAPNRACLGSALVALRQNLQEYGTAGPHGAGTSRKGGVSRDSLTSVSM